jgi:thiamine-phosphate pyrophosphorylase
MVLPRLYPIVDKATLDTRGISVAAFAAELAVAGVGMVQYRDKLGGPQEVLRGAQAVAQAFAGVPCLFVMNDRADLAALSGWGVHVGQGDLGVGDARRVLGTRAIIGISTHSDKQILRSAQDDNLDGPAYVAIGPVFATGTKADAEPVVGLEGVRRARALTKLPLVAIGGITLENARSVIDAGADSVAVIGGLFVPGRTVSEVVGDFLRVLG